MSEEKSSDLDLFVVRVLFHFIGFYFNRLYPKHKTCWLALHFILNFRENRLDVMRRNRL